MGNRSWVVKVKNCKKDIKKCIQIGIDNDNMFCGVVKHEKYLSFVIYGRW